MRFRIEETARIERPCAEVWAKLIDFPRVPDWEDGVLEVRQTSPGKAGLGSTFLARRVYGGRETEVETRIVDWQEGRSTTMEIEGGPMRRSSVCYAVEPIGERSSLVTYRADGELRPLLVWLTPLIPLMGRRLIRKNLATLGRQLEAAARGDRGIQ